MGSVGSSQRVQVPGIGSRTDSGVERGNTEDIAEIAQGSAIGLMGSIAVKVK